ncbi:glycosyltransferase family 2 protein [Brucella anthropi]|uniref:glycosyltransferase family 2 protein n=1 Tax=Brucella anthropi TaxID=529 RepID=UPI0004ED7CF7|nr:glycosyltransferase family 2 protein [Brucella anthropi]AIK45131.1 glycosyl transferase 2 family protein [Brucella anthropi]KAB2749534.1 glycosyltransferase family 2 protein [Brucella anthropi]
MVSISIVVPVYSGESYIPILCDRVLALRTQLAHASAPFQVTELIFVEDGAKDRSGEIIDELGSKFEWVKPFHLSRNYGQHAATVAGITESSGDWVVTMDEDLQHPPEKIERLLEKAITLGGDVVYATPAEAVHQHFMRDWTSRTFKFLMVRLSGNRNITIFNSFRLIRGSIARNASKACGHSTYFDIALSWFTQRISNETMQLKDERFITTGNSGYNLKSLLSHARRLLFSTQVKALRIGSAIGGLAVCLAFMFSLIVTAAKLIDPLLIPVTGWSSLMITIMFFSGVSIFLTGLVIEYVSILIMDTHGKPLYNFVNRHSDKELKTYFIQKSLSKNDK